MTDAQDVVNYYHTKQKYVTTVGCASTVAKKVKAKVYGTIRVMKRENWKGRYVAVSRDRKGRFKSWRKWSPKEPIPKKTEYREIYTKEGTGEEVYKEVVDIIDRYEWEYYKVES